MELVIARLLGFFWGAMVTYTWIKYNPQRALPWILTFVFITLVIAF